MSAVTEVKSYGTLDGEVKDVVCLLKELEETEGKKLRIVYEAGPCAYALYRGLTELGYDCAVASPAYIPETKADRIKTDRRDAVKLARLYRAGELRYVVVLRPEDEAMRDLVRAKLDAVKMRRVLKEAAQSYSYPARVSRTLRERQQGVSQQVKDIS